MRRASGITGVYRRGEPGFIQPGTPAWARMITPSKVAAILSKPGEPISRWESAYRLWHRMKGLVPPEEPKDAFDLGHDAEAYAAARWRRANPGWLLSPDEVQVHLDPNKFGFPAVGTVDRRAVRGSSRRVVETKIARDLTALETWGDDLKGEAPEDYVVQVNALQMFTGWTDPADLFVIGPYFNERNYVIDYSLDVGAWIIDECKTFWDSLAGDEPPELDNSLATYECLRARHPDIDPAAVTLLDDAEAVEFVTAHTAMLDATEFYQGARNRLVKRMECDKFAECAGVKIAERRNNGKGGVSFYPNKAIRPEDIPAT